MHVLNKVRNNSQEVPQKVKGSFLNRGANTTTVIRHIAQIWCRWQKHIRCAFFLCSEKDFSSTVTPRPHGSITEEVASRISKYA